MTSDDAEQCELTPPYGRELLDGMKRRELMELCKLHDIKCTGKNVELIEKLLEVGVCDDDFVAQVGEKVERLVIEDGGEDIKPTELDEEWIKSTKPKLDSVLTPLIVPSCTESAASKIDLDQSPIKPVIIPTDRDLTSIKPVVAQPNLKKPVATTRPNPFRLTKPLTKVNTKTTAVNPSIPTSTIKASIPSDLNPAQPPNQTAPKKKFNLNESLKRPLAYKPHTGTKLLQICVTNF